MRKELIYSTLTGLAVAGSIGLSSFASSGNAPLSQVTPLSLAPAVVSQVTPEKDIETQDDTIALPAGSISEAAASKIATDAHAGTTVTGFETDDEDGRVIYSVSLSNGTDVEIDPIKGTILSTETEANDANESQDTENDPNDRDQDGK